jgi:DNA polymerase
MHINEDGQLVYEGINQYTRKWELLETYYGKLVENIVQAVARDVFMTGMRKAEEAGYCVVLRVHDELVCEVPDDPAFTHEALAAMMGENPSWAAGLPLAAAGFSSYRYRKE